VLEHGGDLGAAAARFGGRAEDWLDLSTGINRLPYPAPPLPAHALTDLPRRGDEVACAAAARAAFGAGADVACLPVAGAQAAIRLIPALRPPGRAAVLGPTYEEHAAAFAAAGWSVTEADRIEALQGFDAAVVVNPNNPDGRRWGPEAVAALAGANGLTVIDESFADVAPEISVCGMPARAGLVVLRSFGKFHGLAGIRLGFALGTGPEIARLRSLAGPWAVSGPALAIGATALADRAWAEATRARLAAGAARLDRLATAAGWRTAGGTDLFRLYETGDARKAQERLAGRMIWSRAFSCAPGWLRLGLPGPEAEWRRLAAALGDASA